MAASECKEIEKCLKDIIFKGMVVEEPSTQTTVDQKLNHDAFSIDDRCRVSNIENTAEIPVKLLHPPGTSELIDFNVLSNFAAKHIADSSLNTTLLSLNRKEVILPHPDLEDDCPAALNGEEHSVQGAHDSSPGISDLLDSISKEIKNSPNFFSMPENPLPQVIGTPKKSKKKPSKKQKKKERMEGLYIPKRKEAEVKAVESKEVVKVISPVKHEDVKIIAKNETNEESSCIKMKKNPLQDITQEYIIFLQEGKYKFQCCLCAYVSDLKDSVLKHVASKNHRSLKTQSDLDLMLPFLPNPLPQQTEAITELLEKIVASEGLTEDMKVKRQELTSRIQQLVKDNFPNCTVELIGSSAHGCALKDSEVDFSIRATSDENLPEYLEKLFVMMKEKGDTFEKVLADFRQKRPCIKFIDIETSLKCTLLIDSACSYKLANVLSTYFKIDDRASKLAVAVRHWAKMCGIDEQENGTLPSFCHTLMVVHFLQQVQPPVLPVLNETNKWKPQNTDSLGELWIKFFHYYNFSYKVGEHVVCIRTIKRLTCKDRNWATRFYAIEDPILRRNLAYVIPTFQVCHYIQECYLRTYRYFAYPQLKTGSVKIIKADSFDALKLSEYVASNSASLKGEDCSEDSENEDYDPVDASPDLEDHDPDLPVEDFIAAVSNISLNDAKEDKKNDELELSSESSTTESTSSPTKHAVKTAKDNLNNSAVKTSNQPLCSWDLKGLNLKKGSFTYEFRHYTFRGDKPFPLTCKVCKGSGHRKKECPTLDLPKPASLPNMTPEFLKAVTSVLYSIRDQFIVSKAELNYIEADMCNVQAYIREVFPDASLKLFGSFCNGFGFRNQSDMDFCLTFGDRSDGKDLDSADCIKKVAKELLLHNELTNVLAITSAKVPIVKFSWRETGLEGDISLYNTLALVNTELLEAYSKIDSRVQVLGYAFKHFAKLVGICDASRGSLSSYAYILMVIFFLQQRNPPVIPVLQELYTGEKPVRLIENWNVWFYRDINKLDQVWPDFGKNTESVGELWQGLLSFYACDFDWKEYVISIKQKSPLLRFRKLWLSNQLAIEDPFDLNHNLGAGLSGKMHTYIMKSFIKARERFGTPVSPESMKPGKEQAYLFNRNFLNSGVEPPQDRGCSNCGKIGHIARSCPSEKACAYCRQPGHLVKNCPKKGRGKKNEKRDKDRSYSFDKQNTDRRNSNKDKHNPRGQNLMKNDHNLNRTYPGMQQPNNSIEAQKLLQMGVPTHRLPPPGFSPHNMHQNNPPPGFKNGNFYQAGNYPPPFSAKSPYGAPFPPGGAKGEMLSQSPPKHHYASSPPKLPFHPPNQPPPWNMGRRQGFNMERHPPPQMSRGGFQNIIPPLPRNPERHLGPPGGQMPRMPGPRNPWPVQPNIMDHRRDPYSNSNQLHGLDHRLHQGNSDNSAYNSNHMDRW